MKKLIVRCFDEKEHLLYEQEVDINLVNSSDDVMNAGMDVFMEIKEILLANKLAKDEGLILSEARARLKKTLDLFVQSTQTGRNN